MGDKYAFKGLDLFIKKLYWPFRVTGEPNPMDEPLHYCDMCGRSEVDDLINGVPGAELIQLVMESDGCWVCPRCAEEGEGNG